MMATELPLADLQERLASAKSGFDRWASAQMNAVNALQEQQLLIMSEADRRVKELQIEETRCDEAAQHLQQLLAKQRAQLDAVEAELDNGRAEEQRLPERIANLHADAEAAAAKNSAEKSSLDAEEARKKRKAEILEKVAEQYRQNMGLRFDRWPKDKFKLVFTNIDVKDPAREASFVLRVAEKYAVEECSPSLSRLPELLAAVNDSGNDGNEFLEFVGQMRSEFVKLWAADGGSNNSA
eukprot:TRINITY_DN33325_c0_g1_i1.p1 TRINITY_DN33325_c0_g1~~TRINITY_DN33325_c0_g1_i1.p1  ORF type:complete len:239 (+),score=66.07 TRINITY_DN33325_c0_g1_i1:600-1316(+)